MASTPHQPIRKRRSFQRWTNHLAIWVALGGVASATHCRRRPHLLPSIDGPPRRADIAPVVIDLGRSVDGELVRHIVGL
jgi:hypothetical protein